ncbi:MAG: TonB family protein [Arenicella sp.]|jgi:TonB family protein
MNDSLASSSVLIISEDAQLVDSLIKNNNTDKEFKVRNSIQLVLENHEILDQNSIVILDLGSNGNDINTAIKQILKIKQQDPTQVLILTGESEILGNMLKSNIQPLIYRAFSKPISPNQVFLAFKSGDARHQDLIQKQSKGIDITTVGPAENRTNVTSLVRETKSKTGLFTGLGLGLVGITIAAWFLLNNQTQSPDTTTRETVDRQTNNTETSSQALLEDTVTVSGRAQQINQLNKSAESAVIGGRIIAPAGDNALEYYEQVLALDAYNTAAYQGKKSVADGLRESYNQMLTDAEFDKALGVISVLQRIEPLNIQNDALLGGLEKAVELHVLQVQKSGSAEDVARTTAVIGKLGSKFTLTNSASNALKKEQAMLVKIDQALESNNLAPPQQGNAYFLVSEALKANSISKANITPRVTNLSQKLLSIASASFATNSQAETEKLIALIKRLNVDPNGLATLKKQLKDRLAAELTAEAAAIETVVQVAEKGDLDQPKIIPAKVISRVAPKYPAKALNRNTEGWVEVSFDIDISGMPINIQVADARPKNLFDSAALRAVLKWRFSPARYEETGLPVQTTIKSTKVHFKLE